MADRATVIESGFTMKTQHPFIVSAAIATMLLAMAGCTNMTRHEKNTAMGAGAGAVGGVILTGGSAAGTIGGAAIGGIIGHEVDK